MITKGAVDDTDCSKGDSSKGETTRICEDSAITRSNQQAEQEDASSQVDKNEGDTSTGTTLGSARFGPSDSRQFEANVKVHGTKFVAGETPPWAEARVRAAIGWEKWVSR